MLIESIPEAQAQMTEIYSDAKVEGFTSIETLNELKGVFLIPIQPQAISEFGEYIYAHAEEFSEEVKVAASSVVDFATSMMWWGLGENSRGLKISKLLRGQSITGDTPDPMFKFKKVNVSPPMIPSPPEL